MAKLLYEEERIRNIAQKIKQYVPYLRIDRFTTKEMADGVEHVHEAGKARGRAEGYDDGRSEGYNIGYTNGCETGYSQGSTDGYTGGYEAGKVDGAENLKTEEARTAADLEVERVSQYDLEITVPSGYYAKDTNKLIDVALYYAEGQIAGYNNGYNVGFADGVASAGSTYEDGNGVKY